MSQKIDVAIVGCGAAGLMAAIQAARRAPDRCIIGLDSAAKLGAKILVAGGGRCNVTHFQVDERSYAGSTPAAIRKVLRVFPVSATISFFRELGVELKQEPTGKLFPTTDSAHTVLDALLDAARKAGVELRHPARVIAIARREDAFELSLADGTTLQAARVVLATGGQALPKSGSDGHGYRLARALGHSTTAKIFPALVPLTLDSKHPLLQLSGVSARVAIELRQAAGKRVQRFVDDLLCTHFGLSGPAVLDISRYLLDQPELQLHIVWLPESEASRFEQQLIEAGRTSAGRLLQQHGLVERLAHALCEAAGIEPSRAAHQVTREQRRRLVQTLFDYRVQVIGNRGFTHAEATAGGVPLAELHLDRMESRLCPGLFLCGELLDVDGRIGGFNFQWAWASGYLAGLSAGG